MSTPSSKKQQQQASARDLKHRVLTCLHKLSDRDTHTLAASELEALSKTLDATTLPLFISSCISSTATDCSSAAVRRHCVRLISVLSSHHGAALSPHLSKLLSALLRRLRDPDSVVRLATVAAARSLSSHLTSSPFTSIAKPFVEALFTEQEPNAQNGAVLCLAAVVEGSECPDVVSLRRMLPRLEKLAKCDGFKAKAGVLALVGCVVGVEGVLGSVAGNGVRDLVGCLVGFLNSEDWSARKAAAEALAKVAVAGRQALSEVKGSCLKTFEARRFDKVKAVRETMNEMIEAWKEIPDTTDEVPQPPESQSLGKENGNDGRCQPRSKTSTPQVKKNSPPDNQARKSSVGSNEKNKGPALFKKLDRKKAETTPPPTRSCGTVVSEDNSLDGDKSVPEIREEGIRESLRPEVRRALFNDNYEKQKLGAFKSGSQVFPCGGSSVVVSNETGDICSNQRNCEDLSLIRKQLFQIENQQSNLLDLLQRYIGSSQNSMHSLEARVHGVELALDEISFDLAVSTGRMSQDSAGCCKLPGTDFLSSKIWRKVEARSSTSRLPASRGTPSVAAVNSTSDKNGDAQGFNLQNRRYQFRGGRGLIMNPLAAIPGSSRGISEVSSSRIVNNIVV